MSNRQVSGWTNPFWILGNYVTRVVPRALFGEDALGGPGTNGDGHTLPLVIPDMAIHTALIWGAWAIVVRRDRHRGGQGYRPGLAAGGDRAAFSVLLFVGEIVNNLPIVQPRYVIAPALLVYTGIVAMLRPRAAAPRPRPAAAAWARPGRRLRPRAGRDLRVQLLG